MDKRLAAYRQEVTTALYDILHYWQQFTVDIQDGGFYGALNNDNVVLEGSPKGGVLNSRILWTFAAAYKFDPQPQFLALADRAFQYLRTHFNDPAYGGIYWSVTATGEPLETRKQVYGQAFLIYALSEYHAIQPSKEVLDWAIDVYRLLEAHSYDPVDGGYYEAFSREWGPISDLRLSAKDDNAAKTMNTHLHVLEAYTNLYRIWPDAELNKKIKQLIELFLNKIIHPVTHQQILFFNTAWEPESAVVSYGHDIETSWLLYDAAEVLADESLLNKVKENAILMAKATIAGVEENGGLQYEDDNKEKHWWVQAEAMVGFFNAWQLSGEENYLHYSLDTWAFVKKYIIDPEKGEWYWGVTETLTIMPGQDKAGFWKCPYHNSRACLELIHRIV
ncbi:AGE family epimerase/isomerase [[Flexibacter] sp. ATCC 35208]|uniref:AGE family epimerase/isomerase n=1 Tax=[Flexibacter] sp. ATCC 35208 TaxID=1936242 RepID=UPI0009C56B2D|nr:AGE family epimerase/isomerase [[Flexibacter] sp. ATCC 35208]OMP76446.1 N-acyl-D-glucosamine 2-epimerase [[Flexibacter] sp. ATCC 35208]